MKKKAATGAHLPLLRRRLRGRVVLPRGLPHRVHGPLPVPGLHQRQSRLGGVRARTLAPQPAQQVLLRDQAVQLRKAAYGTDWKRDALSLGRDQ